MKFSANLGFLWSELSLPDAIRAAKVAGFDAVEMHWPYDTLASEVIQALSDTGLPVLGLNTRRGNVEAGQNGLSALPDHTEAARAAIDEAIRYATQIGAQNVHVMAGFASGPEAERTFCENLTYAATQAASHKIGILIEPLNRHDAPGYFLQTTDQARAIIEAVGLPNVKLMFDCYHVGRTEGDVTTRLRDLLPLIGHVQIASVPERRAPDQGELNYDAIYQTLEELAWDTPIGAEYKPGGPTEPTLNWLKAAR